MVIAEREHSQTAWRHILQSLSMSHATCVTFTEAAERCKTFSKEAAIAPPPLVIIDVDLETIEALSSQSTTSEAVRDVLYELFPSTREIPILTIKDVRLRANQKLASDVPANKNAEGDTTQGSTAGTNSDNEKMQSICPMKTQPVPTSRHTSLSKPFKNSSLVDVLHKLLNTTSARDSSSSESAPASASHRFNTGTFSNFPQPRQQSNTIERHDLGLSNGAYGSTLSLASDTKPLSEFLSSIRTLLVDDNPVNRKVVARMLRRFGVDPLVAENGREAYEIIQANNAEEGAPPISLVFMDVWMPEMNGLESASKIRSELAKTPTEPYIIAMTACVMPGDREKCIESGQLILADHIELHLMVCPVSLFLGMNGYVSKPIRKEELEAAIHTFTQVASATDIA